MLLKAENLSRIYFRNGKGTNFFKAVDGVDISIEGGALTELIGRSGSGKTTLINMLVGLLTPSEGEVFLDGADLYALSDEERSKLRNRYIGIIPQGQTGLAGLTVMENVLAPAQMYGNGAGKRERALKLLEAMEIESLENVYSNELSGGELRRMSIARALINEPGIIIADEPTADLDDETTDDVLKLLKGCAADGAAVLMVTHENAALQYADHVYKMNCGKLEG